ncbi:AAA family ATPase, partial [Bacillus cereus]
MQKMQKSFEKIAALEFANEYCENHTFSKGGQVTVKPVRMMIDKNDGSIYCPRC